MIFGALIVAFISIVGAVLTWKIHSILFRLIIAAVVALAAAYLVYWVPAQLSSGDDQYSSWARLFIETWFIIGLVAGVFAVTVTTLIKNKGVKRNGS